MALQQYVQKLSTVSGFEQAIEAKEDGSYAVHLEPQLTIVMRESGEGVISLRSTLGPLPEERKEEYLHRLMTGNLFGKETGEAALGLDGEGKNVVLSHFLPPYETYQGFYEHLEEFVNYADAWQQETMEFVKTGNAED